ncbi:erythrocyte membrane protein 1, PfEMP1 [Plasmodium sp. gorilla clade G1]|nr:erythrocyte membrane protein 1, PfEMP1 [Plasmodium sp. gorilla clade G1]
MDNKSIAYIIEKYLKEKSDDSKIDSALEADPSEVEYYRSGGDGGYLRKNICKITVNHSDSGMYEPCDRKELSYGDNYQWKCQQNSSRASGKHENKCVPPRRQRMCIRNLEKLNVPNIRNNHAFLADVLLTARNEGERIVQYHPDTNSSNVCVSLERSFADLADIIRGTYEWTGTNNLEKNLKQVFAKIREDSTLKSKYSNDNSKYTKLREAWWNANRQKVWEVITCSSRSNDLLIKRRWTHSEKSDGENKLELCRKCGHYEEKVPTQLDYIPQFLRWLTEWIEDFYREKQKMIDDMERHRVECTKKDDEYNEGTSYCNMCKNKCTKYCECVKKWKSEWENQKNKSKDLYETGNQKIRSSAKKNTSSYVDYVKEFFKILEEDNYTSLENYIKNDPYSKEYGTKLSLILNSLDGNHVSAKRPSNHNDEASNCNELEIASFEEQETSNPSSQKECNTDSSIKPINKKECKDVKLGIKENDRDLKICVIEDDFLRGVNSCCFQDILRMVEESCSDKNQSRSLPHGSCDNNSEETCRKNLEEVLASLQNGCKCDKCKCSTSKKNDKKWIWGKTKEDAAGLQEEYANTIGLPPRTQSLCLGNLHKLENVCEELKDIIFDTKEKFLAGCLIASFHEGKNLKISHEKKNGDNESKLCKTLEYSFADYGDLIKGTSIWDNKYTKDLELSLQKTFGKLFRKYIKKNIGTEQNTLYSSLAELRESWWNTNKKYIWISMKHGAGISNARCGGSSGVNATVSTTCSVDNGSSCDDIPTTDFIPQYLRFLQEWVEHFCAQRKLLADKVVKECKECKIMSITGADKKDNACSCENCKKECDAYKKFIDGSTGSGGNRPTGTAGSPWSKRWDQIYKRYSKHIEDAKRNLEAGTESCGTKSGESSGATTDENKCVRSDIDSFFKHLIDIGLTTPSSYLSNVLDENNCGEDKAAWTTYTTYTTTENCNKQKNKPTLQQSNTSVVVNVPSPLGNTPHSYKYACQCKRPSNKELCDDKKEYMNQWISDNTKKQKGRSTNNEYELYTYNGADIQQLPKRLSSTKLNDKDVAFFNLFEQWQKEIQYEIEQYMTNANISCNNEKKVLGSLSDENTPEVHSGNGTDGNNNTDQGRNCNENCKCYNLWMNKIKEQWESQNQNYNIFEKKTSYANKGSKNKKIVNLSNFLFFSCWEEYIQKQFNGDWSKIKNIGSDTFEFLIKQCGNKSNDGEKIFSGKLKNAQQQCRVTQNTGTNVNQSVTPCDRNSTNYIGGCQSKNYDGFMSPGRGGQKKWICKDTITHGDTNGACIPPRTQNLCVGNLWDKSYGGRSNIKNDTKTSLKTKLKNAIQKETELLYEYHDTGTAIISKNDKKGGGGNVEGKGEQKGEDEKVQGKDKKAYNNNSNGLPKGFCHAVQRSFIDYKNMILGTSVSTYEHIEKLQEDIKKIIEQECKQKGKTVGGGAENIKKWWKEIEREMWNGVKCAIKTNKVTFNGNECGIFPPTGNYEDQFVSWFKEWGEQFCIERLQYEKDIRDACINKGKDQHICINSKNGKEKEIQGECKRNCEKYKKYIAEKKEEWEKQKTKYENKYGGKSASDLLKENCPECISANFDFIFNDNAEYKTYYPYGDYSSICSCEQVKYNKYKKNQTINNKSLCREKGNDMTWSKKYIKKLENGRSLEGVYAPPRRQQLCLYEIFPIIIKQNKNDTENAKKELLETLQIVAEREAYYLWKQYHTNSDKDNLEHKKACCAIRASFYDLADIIKGNDLVHDEYTKYIDTTLNEIFRGGSNENVENSRRSRRDWWENEKIPDDKDTNKADPKTIRQLVWDAMQSGVRYAIKEENERKKQKKEDEKKSDKESDQDTLPLCMVVEHIGIAKPQFIRWLEEWTNQFCEEYTKYFEDMKSNCKDTTDADNCDDNTNIECKKACANYTNWLNPKRIEWNEMSNYYNKIYRKSNKESEDGEDYSMIMAPSVIQYLNKRCHGDINGNYICCSCKNIGENYNTSSTQTIKVQKKKDESCEEEKGPLDAINEVLSKMDKKYRNYKINCTEVYLEHIEEQLKEIENVINDYKLYPLDRCFDDKSKMKVCDLIGDAIGCKDKTNLEELDEWNDTDIRDPYNKYKGVLIPPRRGQLCFSRIVRSPANLRNLKAFKEEILKGALSEGKFLGNYYKKEKDKEKEEDHKEKALEAMKNSFYDYEDIIKGTDMLGNIQFKDIKRKLETLLKKETNGDTIVADDWWKANNKSIWNAMLCGYKKSGNKMLDPSWCTIPTTEKPKQFLRWIKEWGTNVCIQKEKYKQNVKTKCFDVTNIDSDQQESQSKNCIQEITKYQEWSRKRSIQWKAISERYNKDKGKKEFNNINQPDANAYLKEHCSKCLCGYNDMKEITKYTTISNEELKQIKEKVNIPAELEDVIYRIKHHKYDYRNDYICNKYNKNKNIYPVMNHNIDTIWTDNLVKKTSEINKGVLLPPRRRYLFPKIDSSKICQYKKNPEMFKNLIYSSAFNEVQRLNKAYSQDKEKVAHAMKYSFDDIGNIIKGDDMMKNDTSDNIGKILEGKDPKNDNRKKWWDSNKYYIWESMLCGYKNVYRNISENDFEKIRRIPNNDNVNQFLRWFTEWAEDFCHHQEEEIKKLEGKCNFDTCEDEKDNQKKKQCLQACWNYKAFLEKWKKQYKKQNVEFEGLTYTDSIIKDKSAPQYLEENCQDKCSCIKEADSTHYNKSFEYPPEKFQEKCLCKISDPIHPTKIKDSKKTREPEQKKEDPYKDLGKCPFQNSAHGGGTTIINNDSCKNLNDQSSCIQNKYENNLDQWTGKLVRDSSKNNEGVLMPPRRVHLCTRPITKDIYRETERDKFKKDLFDSAYNQGFLLGKTFKDYKRDKTVYEALKNSFYDYGDIVKGKDMMDNYRLDKLNEKLNVILKENNDSSINSSVHRKNWWEKYRTHVWNAILCGYRKGVTEPPKRGRRRGTQSQPVTAQSAPTNTIPSNWCDLPTDGNTDQFLRWLIEWGKQACKEKKELKASVYEKCKNKDGKRDEDCKNAASSFNNWNTIVKHAYDGLNKKYQHFKLSTPSSTLTKENADEYIKEKCSECHCSFKDIEQTFNKTLESDDDVMDVIINKSHIPPHLEDIFNKYNGTYINCPDSKLCIRYKNIPCYGRIHNDNAYWESTFVKKINTTNKNILVPPRRRHICLRIEPNKFRQLKRGDERFKDFIFSSAFSEAKRLKKVYKDDDRKLLQAMKYSFSDIGNIVKGDDMIESPTSKYMEALFKDTNYSNTKRETWWNENKYHVWESMLCGYREAGGYKETVEMLSEKKQNCTFPDIESVPQFLRWFQEWSETFCSRRQKLHDEVRTKCASATCNHDTGKIDSKCKTACKNYSDFISVNKNVYQSLENQYNDNFKSTKGNITEAHVYLKEKSKDSKCDCLSEIFSKDTWGKPYETLDEALKSKCDCQKTEPTSCEEQSEVTDTDENPQAGGESGGVESPDADGKQEPQPGDDTKEAVGKHESQAQQEQHRPETTTRDSVDGEDELLSPEELGPTESEPGPDALLPEEKAQGAQQEAQKEEPGEEDEQKLPREEPSTAEREEEGTHLQTQEESTLSVESPKAPLEQEPLSNPKSPDQYVFGVLGAGASRDDTTTSKETQVPKVVKESAKSISHGSDAEKDEPTQGSGESSPGGEPDATKGKARSGEKEESTKQDTKEATIAPSDDDWWKPITETVLPYSAVAGMWGAYVTKKAIEPVLEKVKDIIDALKIDLSTQNGSSSGKPSDSEQSSYSSVSGDKAPVREKGDSTEQGSSGPTDSVDDHARQHISFPVKPAPAKPVADKPHADGDGPEGHVRPASTQPEVRPGTQSPSLPKGDYSRLGPLFNLLIYGAPLRIGFLLGSVAFLFLYLKRKPKHRPSNHFRVIDIPQNDYDMPTTKSSNRYVPYESDRYKGKTYIYMEGDETDDYSYIRDISSSDITSSSESEYEELDINDIYVPSLPKYKTFIELVLEPSKRDTFNTPSGDTFTNKLTDDEWNQLKQDFIEQYLQNTQKDFILHDSMDEKPFITQIQDRFLDSSHEEVTYNIDWNVPENINRITNIMDDPKYCSNNMYTGTDLINDSLNGNQYIDIYDEMLKRKENELFGTNHTKNTTFNSVSKQTHSDPIINQLDLYHKWIDKHRDICEQWKTKEDMLYKLNEVWNMERKEYLLDILPSTLDDIHKINDETYNIISTNNIYDHPSQETPLQPLGSTNIIPSYITTEQNNGLRTNISMDIHIDENNNNIVATSIIGDDQVENSYNFG